MATRIGPRPPVGQIPSQNDEATVSPQVQSLLVEPLAPLGALPSKVDSPRELAGEARRDHVIGSILEYEGPIIARHPTEAARKLEKLTTSPFVFFRGTADLFYRDLAGLDAEQSQVLAYGDVHPENLGILRAPDGTLFYGLDDFDETCSAPFGWDLRRGATSLELATREQGLDETSRAEIVDVFLSGYESAIKNAKKVGELDGPRYVKGTSAPFVVDLISKVEGKKRSKYLKKYVDPETETFIESAKLNPRPERTAEMQAALEPYRKSLGAHAPGKDAFYTVKDVAERKRSGTGSIGLERLYVLIEGKTDKGKDDYILELKERRPSVLLGHTQKSMMDVLASNESGAAVLEQWARGDRFSGLITLGDKVFKVRERHPRHARIDVASLSESEMKTYAGMMGALVADLHLSGPGKAKKIAQRILKSTDFKSLKTDMRSFAAEAATRVAADHAAFAEALHNGELGLMSSQLTI